MFVVLRCYCLWGRLGGGGGNWRSQDGVELFLPLRGNQDLVARTCNLENTQLLGNRLTNARTGMGS